MSKNQTLPAEDYKKQSKIEENFNVLKKYDDSRFGHVSIVEVPGNKRKLMVREKTFGTKNELTTEIIAVKNRLGIFDDNLLAFVDFSTGERSDLCSTQYWIRLFFEYPDHDIDQELKRRVKSNIIGFNSQELTHMLYGTVKAGSVLHKAGLHHGDICPQLIEMDTPSNYKLVERFGDLAKPEDHMITRVLRGGEIYTAPEAYRKIRQTNGKLKKGELVAQNLQTADVFSLGQSLLHAGTDEGVQGIYAKNGSIDLAHFDKLKRDFISKFPENNLLVSTVLAMVEVEPEHRPQDFNMILSELPPYNVVQQTLQGSQNYQQQANYNQYVSQNQWEKNWTQGQAGVAQHQQGHQAATGALAGHLNLPHENKTPAPQITTSAQTQGQGYGVVPRIGTGVVSSPQDFNSAQHGYQVANHAPNGNVNYFQQPSQQGQYQTSAQVGTTAYTPEGQVVNSYNPIHKQEQQKTQGSFLGHAIGSMTHHQNGAAHQQPNGQFSTSFVGNTSTVNAPVNAQSVFLGQSSNNQTQNQPAQNGQATSTPNYIRNEATGQTNTSPGPIYTQSTFGGQNSTVTGPYGTTYTQNSSQPQQTKATYPTTTTAYTGATTNIAGSNPTGTQGQTYTTTNVTQPSKQTVSYIGGAASSLQKSQSTAVLPATGTNSYVNSGVGQTYAAGTTYKPTSGTTTLVNSGSAQPYGIGASYKPSTGVTTTYSNGTAGQTSQAVGSGATYKPTTATGSTTQTYTSNTAGGYTGTTSNSGPTVSRVSGTNGTQTAVNGGVGSTKVTTLGSTQATVGAQGYNSVSSYQAGQQGPGISAYGQTRPY